MPSVSHAAPCSTLVRSLASVVRRLSPSREGQRPRPTGMPVGRSVDTSRSVGPLRFGNRRHSTAFRGWDRMPSMTVQTFRELLTQRPFKPFRLVMSSGQTYDVRHPEMAMLTRTDLLVGVDVEDDGVPAEFKICS